MYMYLWCLVDNKVKISWGYRGITFNNYLNCQEEQGGLFWELHLFLSWAKYVRIVHLVFGASSCLSFIRNKLDLAFCHAKARNRTLNIFMQFLSRYEWNKDGSIVELSSERRHHLALVWNFGTVHGIFRPSVRYGLFDFTVVPCFNGIKLLSLIRSSFYFVLLTI